MMPSKDTVTVAESVSPSGVISTSSELVLLQAFVTRKLARDTWLVISQVVGPLLGTASRPSQVEALWA